MFRYAKDGGTKDEKAKVESLLDPRFVGRTCEAVNRTEEYLNHPASVSHCRTGKT